MDTNCGVDPYAKVAVLDIEPMVLSGVRRAKSTTLKWTTLIARWANIGPAGTRRVLDEKAFV